MIATKMTRMMIMTMLLETITTMVINTMIKMMTTIKINMKIMMTINDDDDNNNYDDVGCDDDLDNGFVQPDSLGQQVVALRMQNLPGFLILRGGNFGSFRFGFGPH